MQMFAFVIVRGSLITCCLYWLFESSDVHFILFVVHGGDSYDLLWATRALDFDAGKLDLCKDDMKLTSLVSYLVD